MKKQLMLTQKPKKTLVLTKKPKKTLILTKKTPQRKMKGVRYA